MHLSQPVSRRRSQAVDDLGASDRPSSFMTPLPPPIDRRSRIDDCCIARLTPRLSGRNIVDGVNAGAHPGRGVAMAKERTSAKQHSVIKAGDLLRFLRAALTECEKEFETVDARHEQLRKEISELRAQEAFWAIREGEKAAPPQEHAPKPADAATSARIVFPPGTKVVYADVARRVLVAEGRPLRTEQIAKLLGRHGYIPAGDEGRTGAIYSSMARRKTEFLRTRDGCWGLVGRDDDDNPGSLPRPTTVN
jgi:hypothetical protein